LHSVASGRGSRNPRADHPAIRPPRHGAAKFEHASDILFVGNVGEESEGDLRDVKVLAEARQIQEQNQDVLAVDGPDQSLIAVPGVGCKR
jgi:hypothetical protein